MVTVKDWGKMPDGRTVRLFSVKGEKVGFTVSDLGGIITSITAPDRDGNPGEVCLGYDTADEYLADNAYVGAMVGRYSNRIGGAGFELNGARHKLCANEGLNHLHGGGNWNKRIWDAEALENGVKLKLHSPDGEMGYPGNLDAEITVRLDGNSVVMDFFAVSDKDTYVSMTNHAYFNLRGEGNVLSHRLRLNAGAYTPLGEGQIPTGEVLPVEGTVYDFRAVRDVARDDYDLNYVFDGENPAAEVLCPDTGRVLRVHTDLPCIQLYVSEKMTEHKGRGGQIYNKNSGMCLEPQYYPNKPNITQFPGGLLKAGEEYRHRIAFEFTYCLLPINY
ncbi:MAG: galactose mutarotase [Defluviitaleaceae bacterium]|nr:galactose mutarotase [Defluviitaleaceae bacterium]MCL2835201.1 galactose mutarotase [Defluviitaleaceae bacterium]